MTPRFSLTAAAPGVYQAMLGLESYLRTSPLDPTIRHLVKIRASQINGCAYCIDMHWKDARAAGESEQRLYGLDAWRESPYYTDRERAALEWAESLTHISTTHAPDATYDAVRPHFTDRELADLSLSIATINAWNRLVIASRTPAGTYKPAPHPE